MKNYTNAVGGKMAGRVEGGRQRRMYVLIALFASHFRLVDGTQKLRRRCGSFKKKKTVQKVKYW